MVCWQQAKMLYKYRGSLHTRMRTHTPPDEQNQSSGTAELRVVVGCGERCDGRSGCITSHFLPLRPALEGTTVPSANGCFLLLSDTKAMWNGIIGMEGSKMGGHTVQPNRGCALGAIYRSVGARVGLGCR
jgi:hypothetical protein